MGGGIHALVSPHVLASILGPVQFCSVFFWFVFLNCRRFAVSCVFGLRSLPLKPTKPQTQFRQHGTLEVTVNWRLMVSATRKRKQMNTGHDYRAPGRAFCVALMAPLNAHHVSTYRLFMSQVSISGKNSRDQEMPTCRQEMSKKEIKEILSGAS